MIAALLFYAASGGSASVSGHGHLSLEDRIEARVLAVLAITNQIGVRHRHVRFLMSEIPLYSKANLLWLD